MSGIETFRVELPGGIHLSCRAAGAAGRPVMMFLHGFPQAAFIWDDWLLHFAQAKHGGYRCIAPNLRGYADSSAPEGVEAYQPRQLVQDLRGLISATSGGPLASLVAHDWGGALAWKLAADAPDLLNKLVIINAPHPRTFVRELSHSQAQQAASAYMNFLARPDAAERLAENDYRRLWAFFNDSAGQPPSWLTPAMRESLRQVWRAGLQGPCTYYAATPLRPQTKPCPPMLSPSDASPVPPLTPIESAKQAVQTLVIWGLRDSALLPGLLEGLSTHVPRLELECFEEASHWIVHERPQQVIKRISAFLAGPTQ